MTKRASLGFWAGARAERAETTLSSNPKPAGLIATERLVLEPLRVEHAEEMAGLLDDDRLHEFIGGAPLTRDGLRRQYARQAAGRSTDGTLSWLTWILRHRQDHIAVGYVQATVSGQAPAQSAALAWMIGLAFQRQGYAREGTAGAMRALRAAGVQSFTANIHPEHVASIALARTLGLQPTSHWIEGEVVWSAGVAVRGEPEPDGRPRR
jgi:RimJ/RimL family protein N-acetyltransferase